MKIFKTISTVYTTVLYCVLTLSLTINYLFYNGNIGKNSCAMYTDYLTQITSSPTKPVELLSSRYGDNKPKQKQKSK